MMVRYSLLFLLVMGFLVVPLVCYYIARWLSPRKYRHTIGVISAFVMMALVVYGMTFGFEEVEVNHVEYASPDLPQAFDGYRVVLISDVHLGSFSGRRQWVVQRDVDSILAQHPDMIVFTGDVQNFEPSEIPEFQPILKRLQAPNGVFAVLGNHDYDRYQKPEAKNPNLILETQRQERLMGWDLLMNQNRIIRRGNDSIVVAGMENWGDVSRMPRYGDVTKTLHGIDSSSFVLMLQHDPSAWRKQILPNSHAQLTLSGHTHGMQFGIFGWSPLSLTSRECAGFYYEGHRALFVTKGLGGLVPFRLGMPAEIVVITLRRATPQ